jgi:Spy/CpxP family protein refolding chaperone
MRMQGKAFMAGMFVVCLAAVAMAQQPLPPSTPLPTGTISGVVRMADGTPAAGVRVTATRADAADAVTAMASLTQTDATGRYRLESVPPGRYYISAGRVDLPTYYPGTLSLTQGITVSVATAATVSDIDFVIQETSATVPPFRGGLRLRGANATPFGAPLVSPPIPNIQSPALRRPAVTPVRPAPVSPPAPLRGRAAVVAPVPAFPGSLNSALQPGAAWWTNASVVRSLRLTTDQMSRIEAIFEQRRQSILQNKTDLEREEAALARMLDAEPLEPSRVISAAIDKVIQARGEMERTYSTMTLEMRQVLTREQWEQLQRLMPNATPLPTPLLTLPRRSGIVLTRMSTPSTSSSSRTTIFEAESRLAAFG